jgi:hypothetical protein
MKRASYPALFSLLATSALGQTGGFLNSCSGISIMGSGPGMVLYAAQCTPCGPGQHAGKDVTIGLGSCFANYNGVVTPAYK